MKKYLLFTVFISGMTTLAAELAAGRLIGNVFGTSNIVWASIIGLILIYLTLGYFLGGKWADANPTPAAMYRVLAWGAFTLGLVPYVASPVLRAAATAFDTLQVGILGASFVAVLILFIVPITLLGTISPYAIRLTVDDTSRAGQTSGQIYAISTLGSFIGTFLPTLVTIPAIGTKNTFLLFSMILLLVALVGLARFASQRDMLKYIWMPFVLIALALLTANQSMKASASQIYETESAYNYIEVLNQNGFTILRLNEGQGVHSIYHPDTLQYNGPWDQFLVSPYFYANRKPSDIKRVAIVGLAAGTTARQMTAVYGNIPIDGYELDPKIVEVGRKYFDMTMPNLNVIIGDGRLNLERSEQKYDIIAVDAYRPPYIPPHMTTQEFFEICASHLTEDGYSPSILPASRRPPPHQWTPPPRWQPSSLLFIRLTFPLVEHDVIFATKQKNNP
ncbi:MAG: fused MFS/spermidine synthase [Anaerolineales bacterium]